MISSVFSVFDTKAAFFAVPFVMQREQMAIRAFSDLVNDPNTSVNKHPEDYALYVVGMFDDSTGVIEAVQPKCLVTAASCLRPPSAVVAYDTNHKGEVLEIGSK